MNAPCFAQLETWYYRPVCIQKCHPVQLGNVITCRSGGPINSPSTAMNPPHYFPTVVGAGGGSPDFRRRLSRCLLSAGQRLHPHPPLPSRLSAPARCKSMDLPVMTGLACAPSLSPSPTTAPPDPADHVPLSTHARGTPGLESY